VVFVFDRHALFATTITANGANAVYQKSFAVIGTTFSANFSNHGAIGLANFFQSLGKRSDSQNKLLVLFQTLVY
jgi:hypothetical protein